MFGSSTYRPVPLTSSRSSPFSRHLVSLSLCELFSVGPRLILNHSVGMLPVENTHTHTHTRLDFAYTRDAPCDTRAVSAFDRRTDADMTSRFERFFARELSTRL